MSCAALQALCIDNLGLELRRVGRHDKKWRFDLRLKWAIAYYLADPLISLKGSRFEIYQHFCEDSNTSLDEMECR